MKKLLVLLFSLFLLAGCGSSNDSATDDKTIKVSATAEPHATILEFAKPILEEQGYNLEIEILDNYFIFNSALDAGDVDANYFQHLPFFEGELATKGYKLENAGQIHIEPFGFYSQNYKSIDEIKDGATVVISNSVADHGRLLAILANAGLIKLDENVAIVDVTLDDIVENPKNLDFKEVNPEVLTTVYKENSGDLIAINGNYAISAGLNPVKDALILESADENNPYVNIVACREGEKDSEKIKALVDVLQSEEVKAFISEHYSDGSVIPANN